MKPMQYAEIPGEHQRPHWKQV